VSRKNNRLSVIGLHFVKPELIFKILSLLQRAQYLQQKLCNSLHHALIMLLHYLGKLKQLKFAANLAKM